MGTKAQLVDSRGDLQLQNQVLVFTQSLDHKVCVQSRMEQSVVKVTPEGPASCQVGVWGCVRRSWPGAHPLRECGVLGPWDVCVGWEWGQCGGFYSAVTRECRYVMIFGT